MNSLDILDKEIEIAYEEAFQMLSLESNQLDIQMYLEEYDEKDMAKKVNHLIDAADKTVSFFEKIVQKIKDLYEKVKKFVTDFISQKGNIIKVNQLRQMEKEELEKKKIKVLNHSVFLKHCKKYRESVMRAKSIDEVDKILKKYKLERNAMIASTAYITYKGAQIISYLTNKSVGNMVTKEYNDCVNEVNKLGKLTTEYQKYSKQYTDTYNKDLVSKIKQSGQKSCQKMDKFYDHYQTAKKIPFVHFRGDLDDDVQLMRKKSYVICELACNCIKDYQQSVKESYAF